MKKYSTIFLLALLAAIAGYLALYKGKPLDWKLASEPALNIPSATAPAAVTPKFERAAKIELPASVPAGKTLSITKVSAPKNSFVVIKDKAGKIVGASNLIIFPETADFKMGVTLLSGKSYVAELHGDNGNGVFDPKTDPPIVVSGKTVAAPFTAK
jgi:hypothetical protein